ncbi:MAG: ubiquinol-cytochrome C chaperone family protein [Rickettsiales bacterium]
MIASFFRKIFSPPKKDMAAHHAYVSLVKYSRNPYFYQLCEVEDTIDGRFDVIILHIFMVTHCIRDKNPEFIRNLWEVFFSDMDRNLREMGTSDTGIGKRIKKMVKAFYGRMDSYEKSLDNKEKLTESLKRNLYRGKEVEPQHVSSIVAYIKRNIDYINGQDVDLIAEGKLDFCN